ncbi:MAG: M20/M25/M40 family metallo-hydrolase [Candidatus Vogelbacteria bacterium]|nr:M20/M25/M40 family metallo-hydrolase [Candidatus Vogelbacteria bacterium]
MINTKKAQDYFKKNSKNFIEQLARFVAIPSISSDSAHTKDVDRSANSVAAYMRSIGLEHVEILQVRGGKPAVYGDWLHASTKTSTSPTLLLYAHHDVQPTGEHNKWKTEPFKAVKKGDRLYGRGAADDKGGLMMHLAAIASYLKTKKKLPVNVKCLFEGEEEIGSPTLVKLLTKYRKKLEADVMVLSDTENYAADIPGITIQLRGLISCHISISALEKPVHSGGWGGPIPDPALAMAKLLAKLTDGNGRMAIPNVYEDVELLSSEQRALLKKLPFDLNKFRKHAGVLEDVELVRQGDATPHEMIWHLPSLSVNVIQVSSRAQASNVIMDSAWAQIGIRLVPNMMPEKVIKLLDDFLKKNVEKGFRLDVKMDHVLPPWKTSIEHPAFRAAERALKKGYGKEPVYMGCGGSIGFVEPFAKALKAPALLIGVEDPETAAHSWNESLHLGGWQKGVVSMIELLGELAESSK